VPLLEKKLNNEPVDGWSGNFNNALDNKGGQDMSGDYSLLKRMENENTMREQAEGEPKAEAFFGDDTNPPAMSAAAAKKFVGKFNKFVKGPGGAIAPKPAPT